MRRIEGGFPRGNDLLGKLVLITLARGKINYSAEERLSAFVLISFYVHQFLSRVRVKSQRIIISYYYIATHYYTASDKKEKALINIQTSSSRKKKFRSKYAAKRNIFGVYIINLKKCLRKR